MNNPQLHKLLSDIEVKSSDDFAMLEDCGAEYFSTPDLLEMRGKWKEQMRMFKILHRANIYIGSTSPLWLVVAGVCGVLGLGRGVLFSLTLFPLTLFIFLGISIFLRQTYRSKGWLDFVGREINSELNRRQSEEKKKRKKR